MNQFPYALVSGHGIAHNLRPLCKRKRILWKFLNKPWCRHMQSFSFQNYLGFWLFTAQETTCFQSHSAFRLAQDSGWRCRVSPSWKACPALVLSGTWVCVKRHRIVLPSPMMRLGTPRGESHTVANCLLHVTKPAYEESDLGVEEHWFHTGRKSAAKRTKQEALVCGRAAEVAGYSLLSAPEDQLFSAWALLHIKPHFMA